MAIHCQSICSIHDRRFHISTILSIFPSGREPSESDSIDIINGNNNNVYDNESDDFEEEKGFDENNDEFTSNNIFPSENNDINNDGDNYNCTIKLKKQVNQLLIIYVLLCHFYYLSLPSNEFVMQ